MADDSDFEFDDDGIYREKTYPADIDDGAVTASTDTMHVDEDGIWREATDDDGVWMEATDGWRLRRTRDSGMGSTSQMAAWPPATHSERAPRDDAAAERSDEDVIAGGAPRRSSIAYLLTSNVSDDGGGGGDLSPDDGSRDDSIDEFENLEASAAAAAPSLSAIAPSSDVDALDLVGTYLRGLQRMDDADRAREDSEDDGDRTDWQDDEPPDRTTATDSWLSDSLLQPSTQPLTASAASPRYRTSQSLLESKEGQSLSDSQVLTSLELTAGSQTASQLTQIAASRLSSTSASPRRITTARSQLSTATSDSGRSLPATPHRSASASHSDDATAIRVTLPADNRRRGGDSLRPAAGSGRALLRAPLYGASLHRPDASQENEETLNTLQIEYNSLLRKYAEAENTIDELRLGAKVSLYSDSPVPSQAVAGSLAPAQHAQTFSIARMSSASLTNLGTPSTAAATTAAAATASAATVAVATGSVYESRPDSRASLVSGSVWSTRDNGTDDMRDSNMSLAGDGVKLALLAKVKAIQEQTGAFQTLLSEGQLTVEDQARALANVRSGCERLQQQYHDAKHDRRRHLAGGGEDEGRGGGAFDDDRLLEGELYRLNMTLDELEQTVQGNVRGGAAKRVPFQAAAPVRADHSIDVRGMATALGAGAGGSGGEEGDSVDRQLDGLQKAYGALLDRYHRVKAMRRQPQRDAELNQLLRELREIYQKTPNHKPPLPQELESQYDSIQDVFMESSVSASASSLLPQNEESSHVDGSEVSSDTNKVTTELSVQPRAIRPDLRLRATTTSDADSSAASVPSAPTWRRRGAQLPLPGRRGGKGRLADMRGRLGEREDSGYVGSVSSRRGGGQGGVTPARLGSSHPRLGGPASSGRRLGGLQAGGRPLGGGQPLGGGGPLPPGRYPGRDSSESSHSDSGASTVEERVAPLRPVPLAATRAGGGATVQAKTAARSLNRDRLGASDSRSSRTSDASWQRANSTANQHAAIPAALTTAVGDRMRLATAEVGQSTAESVELHSLKQEMAAMRAQLASVGRGAGGAGGAGGAALPPQTLHPLLHPTQQMPASQYGYEAVYPLGTYPNYAPGVATVPVGGVLPHQQGYVTGGYGVSAQRPYDTYTREGGYRVRAVGGTEGGGADPYDPYTEHKFERRSGSDQRNLIRDPYHGGTPRRGGRGDPPMTSRDVQGEGWGDEGRAYEGGYESELEMSWRRRCEYDGEDDDGAVRAGRYGDEGGAYPHHRPVYRVAAAPPPPPPPPPQYPQNVCGACGGVGYHSDVAPGPVCAACGGAGRHGDQHAAPVTTATFTPTPWVGVPPAGATAAPQYVVGVPPVTRTPENTAMQTGQTLVACQLVPLTGGATDRPVVNSHRRPRVRYYVREYGTDSESEVQAGGRCVGRRYSLQQSHSMSLRKDSQELDDSLVIALQTAKHLKKVSGRMRESLHSELVRCHQQAPVVSGY